MTRPLLAAALACLALVGCRPVAAEPALWVVEDADSTLVLFGSFHLLPPEVAWRPEALDLALAQADDLWFEVPVEGPVNGADQAEMMRLGVLPPDETLSSLLSEEGARRLTAVAAAAGASLPALERMQPWLAETTLGLAVYRQQGALADEGVERQIARAAPPSVERRALESASGQIGMLARGSRAEQVASLEQSLRTFEQDPGYFRRLMELWLGGDAAGLDREVLGDLRRTAPEQYRTLILERNRAWLPQIEARMAGSGRTVVIVGVGHLVGRDGLPALLRRRGLTVRGP